MAEATTDHGALRKWAKTKGGKRAAVAHTHKGDDVGIMFPDSPGSEHDALTEISWDELFGEFAERKLALAYEEGSQLNRVRRTGHRLEARAGRPRRQPLDHLPRRFIMSQRTMPAQAQERQPGREAEIEPRPRYEPRFRGSGRLDGKVALPHLQADATIVNTTSVTAYRGSAHLLDHASTRDAIVAFTRSLAQQLADWKFRVNGVAPGPIWTPLIPASFDDERVSQHGASVPLGRPGQPKRSLPAISFSPARTAPT